MRSRIRSRYEERRHAAWSLSVVLLATAGCAHVNNPFKDSGALIDIEMTTASTEGYRGKTEFAATRHRAWEPATVRFQNGAVSHWPQWFEDSLEDKGNDYDPADRDVPDNRFAWNWVDYAYIFGGPARMTVNTMLYPISAIVTPPGTLMESNGRIDKGLIWHEHDAKRSDPATREPPDVNRID